MLEDINTWNDRIIAEFRANNGYVRWSSEDDLSAGRPLPPQLPTFPEHPSVPLILVHHLGAKTGRARINPMIYQSVDDGFAVFATYGGNPHHPAWYHNLLAHPHSTVEIGDSVVSVRARVTESMERARIWHKQIELMPMFAEFEIAAGRRVPVVVLQRI